MSLVVFYWDMKLFNPLTGYTVCKDNDHAMQYLADKTGVMRTALKYEITNHIPQVVSLKDKWAMTFPEMYTVARSFLDMAEHQGWKEFIPEEGYKFFHY